MGRIRSRVQQKNFKDLFCLRIGDSDALSNSKRVQGCMYMACLAIECALKYYICATSGIENIEQHPIKDLTTKKGHDIRFILDEVIKYKPSHDSKENSMLRTIKAWSQHDYRYKPPTVNDGECKDFLKKVKNISNRFIEAADQAAQRRK